MKIVIRCGGAGTRLWPVSREKRPKQFQSLLGQKSLFEEKLRQIRPLVKRRSDLYVSTVREYVPIVHRLAPSILPDHIIAEPVRRNTGPGIALETTIINAQQPKGEDAVIASLTVDDVMHNARLFRQLIAHAARYLEEDDPFSILTIACPVDSADTGLSYLVLGRTVSRGKNYAFRRVERWIEKPAARQLGQLLRRQNVAAHTGLYLWRASTVLNILEAHEPVMFARLQRIRQAFGTGRYRRVLERQFSALQSASVEELIAKRAARIIAAVADLGWKDTGKWWLVQEVRRRKPGDNVTEGQVVAIDTEDSIVYAPRGKLVATIGLKGYVVIDTGDALLVCPKERSGDVKKVVEHLQRQDDRKTL